MTRCITAKLDGDSLNWAVAQAKGQGVLIRIDGATGAYVVKTPAGVRFAPTSDAAQGAAVLQGEPIQTVPLPAESGSAVWYACYLDAEGRSVHGGQSEDERIAALRCLVYSKFGASIDIPDELLAW